jgi:hypothetical protein
VAFRDVAPEAITSAMSRVCSPATARGLAYRRPALESEVVLLSRLWRAMVASLADSLSQPSSPFGLLSSLTPWAFSFHTLVARL